MAIDRLGFYDSDQVKQFLTPGGSADLSGSFQTTNAILNGLSALDTTSGIVVQTGASTFTKRTLTAPAAGITVNNGTGAGGNPTIALANDLAALEALSGTNTIYYRSGVDTWTAVTIGSGLTFSSGTLSNSGTPTGTALTKTDDTNVTLTLGGTPATALLQATSLTLGWTGQLGVTRGGTGLGSLTQGDLVYASATNTLSVLSKNTTAQRVLTNGGTSNNPAWGQVDLTTGVTGVLPSGNGGVATTNGARVFNSAAISIANITATALTFDSERRDDGSIHSTVSNTDRLTAPTAGWYYIWGNVEYASNLTGFRTTSIRLNVAATIIAATQSQAVNGDNTIMNVSCLYYLSAGDYVKLYVYQSSGGALNINASATYSPEFGMVKVAA